MQNTIICISRSYGSGGRAIGKLIAEHMNLPFYDRNLIYMASEKNNIDLNLLAVNDESLNKNFSNFRIPDEKNKYISKENIFLCQSKIIKEISDKNSCIIIGRCAGHILRNTPHKVLRVFIWAPEHSCIDTVMKKFNINESEASKIIKQINKHREDYYKHHTKSSRSDARNYDLCIDTSRMTYENAAKAIEEYSSIFSGL